MAKRKSEAANGDSESSGRSTATSSPKSAKRSKKSNPAARSDIIDEVNALDRHEFTNRYFDTYAMYYHSEQFHQSQCTLEFASDISEKDFDDCFQLIEATSRKDYEASSWGWHPKRKRREMKEKEMRYIVMKKDLIPYGDGNSTVDFEGFLSFMFTHDSAPSVPVLYIYEIHLTENARGKGLGLRLLYLAESMARKVGVKKVMLTCFLSNTNALSFYKRHGFRKDACSPGDRRTRNKVVKVDYVIMSKDLDATQTVNGDAVQQVMEEESMESLISDRTDEVPSLDDCPSVMRSWIDDLKQQELLDLGLAEAEKARHLLSSDRDQEATQHRDILSALFQCLKTRYEAARDLGEVLMEQMYHLKSHILDVDRMARTLTASMQHVQKKLPPSQPNEENFDWDKATEQVYSAFYTLLRKAEEVDNRLDDIVEREQEADQREDDLDGREEELDNWENDIHEREKALADREERLMRSKQRMKRLKGANSRDTEEQYQYQDHGQYHEQYHDEADEWEGEPERALPWRQEAPPQNKVDLWLHRTSPSDDINVDPGD